MNKINQNFFKDFKTREKTLSFFGKNQYSDWKILLSILGISFFIAIFIALFTYYNRVESVDLFGSPNIVISNKKVNKEILMGMLGGMESRKENYNELIKNKPVVSDPGL